MFSTRRDIAADPVRILNLLMAGSYFKGYFRKDSQSLTDLLCLVGSVADPYLLDAYPDSTCHPDADPDSDFIFCEPGCGSGSEFSP